MEFYTHEHKKEAKPLTEPHNDLAKTIGNQAMVMQCCNKSQRPKRFTAKEDAQLESLVKQYGYEWKTIQGFMPDRTAKQCRTRYTRYLHPYTERIPWSDDDIQLLQQKVEDNGRKWEVISTFFPGRDATSIRYQYSRLTGKKNVRQGQKYEMEKANEYLDSGKKIVDIQTSIQPGNGGGRIRADMIVSNSDSPINPPKLPSSSTIKEFKSSMKAPLTHNQILGFPELLSYGGFILDGPFAGELLPPGTKTDIERPDTKKGR